MIYSCNTSAVQPKLDIRSALKAIFDAGFPAADISLDVVRDYAEGEDYREVAKELREYARSRGAVINQAHAPFGGGPVKYPELLVPLLPRMIEFAAIAGAKAIVVHPIHGEPYQENKEMIFDRNIEFYRTLAPVAKRFGIKIAIENMWQRRPVSNYIDDDIYADPHELARAYDILADPEAFTVCLDIGHVAICGRDPAAAVRVLGSRIGALHVHDVDYLTDTHTLPGQGKIDWDGVCCALAQTGYSGDLTLEVIGFSRGYDEALYPSALRMMNDVARFLANKVEEYKAQSAL